MSRSLPSQDVWEQLDAALIGIRRICDAPPGKPLIEHDGNPIEISTLLVVDAVTRNLRCSVTDVAHALSVTPSTASRLVERAVATHMVQRVRSDKDSRRVELHLTPQGRQLHDQGVRFRTNNLADLLADWNTDELRTLAGLLTNLSNAVHNQPEQARRAPSSEPGRRRAPKTGS